MPEESSATSSEKILRFAQNDTKDEPGPPSNLFDGERRFRAAGTVFGHRPKTCDAAREPTL